MLESHGISESGVNRSCGRFEKMMERDKDLGERLKSLTGKLKESNVYGLLPN